MSRAFVDESASDLRDEGAPEFKIPLPPGARNYLTPEGAVLLTEELHSLETEKRPKLAAEITRLSADPASGDALATARRSLFSMDRRIEYLSRMASLAEVVPRPEKGFDRVRFGARVTVRVRPGVESSYRIVGVDEADPEKGLLGWTAPLARALIGKGPGEKATIQLPEGETTLTIVSVE